MAEELLRFIRNYSHDFQNHLQVISGLVQLNRTERIREYVGEVSAQIREISKLAKIAPPEVATALLAFHQQVARYRIPLVVGVRTDLGDWPSMRDGTGDCLIRFFGDLGRLLTFLEGAEEPVLLTIMVVEAELVFQVELPAAARGKPGQELEENLFQVSDCLAPIGGRAELLALETGTILLVSLSRRGG